MFSVGLTGGLKTGKSTVASMFKSFGATILDADKIVHQEMRADGACVRPVVQMFGKDILKSRGIDRSKLGAIVFNDIRKLKQLERIVHPIVRQVLGQKLMQYKRSGSNRIIIVEVPLLFEAKFESLVNTTICVKANQTQQIQRAVKQLGIRRQQALQRIHAQMSMLEKTRLADYIIDTRGTKQETRKQVRRIWQKLQKENQILKGMKQ